MKTTKQLLGIMASTLAAMAISSAAMAQSTPLAQLYPALSGVELQPSQQGELERISQQALAQVKQSLSPEQSQKFDLAIGQGKSVRATLAALDLSSAQKRTLQQKLQSNRSQLLGILTPQQQQQVARNAASLRQQMGGSK